MYLSKLKENDKHIILQCMRAISRGNFVQNEFQTRLGINEREMETLIAAFPLIDDSDDDSIAALAINNSLNEFCHGLSVSNDEWAKWFSISRYEIIKTYNRWAKLRGWSGTAIK